LACFRHLSLTAISGSSTHPIRFYFSLEFERHVRVSELIRLLSEHHAIRDLSLVEPDIEATIRQIYEGDLLNQT
jgi:ABC-type uncharacterized transport system ATPase subunit